MSKFKIGDRVAKNTSLIYDRYENSKEGPLRYVEFNATEKELKVKFKEIAKAIREANKVAQKTGHNLADMYNLVNKDLYPAMDAAGWQTSSFNC